MPPLNPKRSEGFEAIFDCTGGEMREPVHSAAKSALEADFARGRQLSKTNDSESDGSFCEMPTGAAKSKSRFKSHETLYLPIDVPVPTFAPTNHFRCSCVALVESDSYPAKQEITNVKNNIVVKNIFFIHIVVTNHANVTVFFISYIICKKI